MSLNNVKILVICFITLLYSVKSEDTCKDNITDTSHNIVDVASYCTDDHPCISKCCNLGEFSLLEIFNRKATRLTRCISIEEIEKKFENGTKFLNYDDFKTNNTRNMKYGDFRPIINQACDMIMISQKNYAFNIFDNGTLLTLRKDATQSLYPVHEYCMEKLIIANQHKILKTIYLYNITNYNHGSSHSQKLYMGTGYTVSAIFLLLTLLVYCLLKSLRNIQGMILMAYLSSLCIEFIINATLNYFNKEDNIEKICIYLSPIAYLFMLCAFCWLNVMSLDIWWTFRSIRKIFTPHSGGQRKKFMWYSAYGYGVPCIITAAAIAIDKSAVPPNIKKPLMSTCMSGKYEQLYYIYVPIAIATFVNIIMFCLSVYNIIMLKRDICKFNNNSENNKKITKERFILFLKVGTMMGVNSMLDVIVQFADPHNRMPPALSNIISVINLYIGVIMFIIFCCKRSIFYMLCKRMNWDNRFVRNYKNNSSQSKNSKSTKSTTTQNIEIYTEHNPESGALSKTDPGCA